MFLRGVSKIRLNSLFDYMGHDYMVRVCCTNCRHTVDVTPLQFIRHCRKQGLPLHIHRLQRRLRCRKCRKREAEIVPGGYVKHE